MTVKEKVAYVKGLAEGLNLDTEKSKEAKLLTAILDVLDEVGTALEDLEEAAYVLGDEIDLVSEDLEELTSIFSDDFDHEDDHHHHHHDHDSPLECPDCQGTIELTEQHLLSGDVTCDHCNSRFHLHLYDDEETTDTTESTDTTE